MNIINYWKRCSYLSMLSLEPEAKKRSKQPKLKRQVGTSLINPSSKKLAYSLMGKLYHLININMIFIIDRKKSAGGVVFD